MLIVARCGDIQHNPESTLPAFEQAILKGADTIELDVHLTQDDQFVIHHDYYLGRTDNGSGYIGDQTLADLRKLDAGGWFDARFRGEKIPTLQEVFDLGKNRVRFEIDMKGSSLRFLNRVNDEVTRFDLWEQVELTTSHTPLVAHMNPAWCTGMFFYPLPDWMKPALGQQHITDWMILANAKVAHLHSSLIEPEFVARLHGGGFGVHGANLNTADDMRKGIAAGIDQFSTDQLELANRLRA